MCADFFLAFTHFMPHNPMAFLFLHKGELMSNKWVYTFGNGHAEGQADMRNLLGGKGANLAEMNLVGLPVPAGFTNIGYPKFSSHQRMSSSVYSSFLNSLQSAIGIPSV